MEIKRSINITNRDSRVDVSHDDAMVAQFPFQQFAHISSPICPQRLDYLILMKRYLDGSYQFHNRVKLAKKMCLSTYLPSHFEINPSQIEAKFSMRYDHSIKSYFL